MALSYADQASLERQEEIESLTAQIERLRYIQESALEQQASLKLDREIMDELLASARRWRPSGWMWRRTLPAP